MRPAPIQDYVLTPHAVDELERRQITKALVSSVMHAPEQIIEVRTGRVALQSRVQIGGVTYLLRVFVDVDRQPAEVVTAYRTSKIAKYWRTDA